MTNFYKLFFSQIGQTLTGQRMTWVSYSFQNQSISLGYVICIVQYSDIYKREWTPLYGRKRTGKKKEYDNDTNIRH
jgi:hypothetical protein